MVLAVKLMSLIPRRILAFGPWLLGLEAKHAGLVKFREEIRKKRA